MKTGKKVSITILSVLILALCAVGIIRSTTFPLDPATLPDHICDFYNIGRPQPLSPSIRVYDSVELENTVWYLIEIGEDIDLGYVKLERNILGRYKIVHLGYGGGRLRRCAQWGESLLPLWRPRCDRPHRKNHYDAERRDLHDGKCGGKDAFPVLHRAFSTARRL